MKLIYCFNLLHCRLNKLKDSFFSLKLLLAQGRKRLHVPPTCLKGEVAQWWSAEKRILERTRPRMNWWWLYTLVYLGIWRQIKLFFSYISMKNGPTLSAVGVLRCDDRGILTLCILSVNAALCYGLVSLEKEKH